MNNLTDVVKNLLIINVIVFLALKLPYFSQWTEYFVYIPFEYSNAHPVGIVSHMFSHMSPTHIFFNMLTLYFFGPNVERVWGPKRFLFFYLLCGLGSIGLHMLVDGGSALGASGAISGVLLAFAYLYPEAKVMLLIPPIPMKAKYMVGMLLAVDLYLGLTGTDLFPGVAKIAHFAHLGGAITGALLILLFRKQPTFMR